MYSFGGLRLLSSRLRIRFTRTAADMLARRKENPTHFACESCVEITADVNQDLENHLLNP